MSSGLVPKPKDWKSHIGMCPNKSILTNFLQLFLHFFVDIVGFYFLDLATNYTPPDDLATFLAAGEPPVYIGFGSVVVDDSAAMTSWVLFDLGPRVFVHALMCFLSDTIFEATKQAGVRALVSAGWASPIITPSVLRFRTYFPTF